MRIIYNIRCDNLKSKLRKPTVFLSPFPWCYAGFVLLTINIHNECILCIFKHTFWTSFTKIKL